MRIEMDFMIEIKIGGSKYILKEWMAKPERKLLLRDYSKNYERV